MNGAVPRRLDLARAAMLLALTAMCACASRRGVEADPQTAPHDETFWHGASTAAQAPHGRTPSGRAAPFLVARAWAGREPMTTARAWAAVDFAGRQIGKRYCWGGTGPGCFDCSGLVQRAWEAAGVVVPRTADAVASSLDEIPIEDVRSGDILWWPGHVAIYAGYGWTIEALDARDGVVRRPSKNPRRAFRPHADDVRFAGY